MATETEFTFATTQLDTSQLDLAGKTQILNHQGYAPNTGTNGFRVLFDYHAGLDTALMHLEMKGRKKTTIEIANPLDPNGFDMQALVSQQGFFIRPRGVRNDFTGELIIGQLPDGRSSELRSIMSPGVANMSCVGVKIDTIDPSTGLVDPTTRIECERKKISNDVAGLVLRRFCGPRQVQKAFYDLPDMPQEGVHCYLQQFVSKAHEGLVLAEFEMPREAAESFKPPSWLKGAFDVTSVPNFRTRALAMGGTMWRSVFNTLSNVADGLKPAPQQHEAYSL